MYTNVSRNTYTSSIVLLYFSQPPPLSYWSYGFWLIDTRTQQKIYIYFPYGKSYIFCSLHFGRECKGGVLQPIGSNHRKLRPSEVEPWMKACSFYLQHPLLLMGVNSLPDYKTVSIVTWFYTYDTPRRFTHHPTTMLPVFINERQCQTHLTPYNAKWQMERQLQGQDE